MALVLFFFYTTSAMASNQSIVYQGRILRPDGTVLNTGSITFTLALYSRAPKKCLLYSETQSLNMTGSSGMFSLALGTGTRSDGGAHAFDKVFVNGGTLTGLTCADGTTSYSPAGTDDRSLVASFNDNGTVVTLSAMEIKSIPFALQAHQIAGYGINDLIKVHPTTGSATTFTAAEMAVAKTITALSCGVNEIIKYNGTTWACSSDATGGSPSDASYLAKGVVQFDTNAATSGLSVASGVVKLSDVNSNVGTFGSATKTVTFTVNAQGRVTAASHQDIAIPASQITQSSANNGEVLKWNGTAWAPAADATGTSPGDSSYAAKGIVQFDTDAATSGVSVTTGVAKINTGTGANQIVKLNSSSQLPAVDGSLLTNLSSSAVAAAGAFVNGGNAVTATATLGTNSNHNLAIETNGTTRMTILNDGSVGIGVTPAHKLHVASDVTNAPSWHIGTRISSANSGSSGAYSGNNALSVYSLTDATGFGGHETYGLQAVAETGADATGQTGYSVFSSTLTHANDVGMAFYAADQNDSTGGTQYGLYIHMDDTDVNRWGIYQNSDNPNYFAGKMGIGTNDPKSKLHVAGGIQIGNDADTCDATKAGTFRYTAGNAMEFCNATAWTALAASGTFSDASYSTKGILRLDTDAATSGLSVSSGVLKLATTGVSANTYKSVTVDTFGRVTGGTNPTTLSGFGITDAVQNVGGAISFQAASLASRPVSAAGTAGAFYYSTDTNRLFRDSGSGWASLSVDASNVTTGTLPVARGGTGAATLTADGVLLGNGTSAVTATAAGAAYSVLRVPSGGGAPVFGAIELGQSAAVTGTLGIGNGGTGVTALTPDRILGTTAGGGLAFVTCAQSRVISFDASGVWGCYDVNTLSGSFINGGNTFAATATLGTNSNHDLEIETNGSTKMTVKAGGNVGIGTTSPSGVLHVTGGTAANAVNGTSITLQAQNAGAGNQTGGDVLLIPGTATGTGGRGSVGIGLSSITQRGALTIGSSSSHELIFEGASGATIYQSALNQALNISTNNGLLSFGGSASGSHLAINSSGLVGVGATAPSANLEVRSTGDNSVSGNGIRITASDYATNGGYLTINKNSGTGTVGSIQVGDTANYGPLILNASGGYVGVGTTTPNSKLDVYSLETRTTASKYVTIEGSISVAPTAGLAGAAHRSGVYGEAVVPGAVSNAVRNIYGVDGLGNYLGSGGASLVSGGNFYAYNGGSGANAILAGVYAGADASGSGTVTNLTGIQAESYAYSGAVTNQYGASIYMESVGTTVTNRYGIYLHAPAGTATNDYGIYQEPDKNNYFKGNVGINDTSPEEKLKVNGNVKVEGGQIYVAEQTSSGGSPLTFNTDSGNAMLWTTNTVSPTVNVHNLKAGGAYTLTVRGTGTGTVTINCYSDAGTTALTSSFVPANGARATGTANITVYNIIRTGNYCLITWITGF